MAIEKNYAYINYNTLPVKMFQMIIQTLLVQVGVITSKVAAFQPLAGMNPTVGFQ